MKNMPKKPELVLGTYRHYKGDVYEVVSLACHTETLEWYVVYESLERKDRGLPSVWIRPYEMFIESVIVGGKEIPRFQKLSDE